MAKRLTLAPSTDMTRVISNSLPPRRTKGVRQPVAVVHGLEVGRAGEQQALADAARLRLALQVHPTRVEHAHTLAGVVLLLQLVVLRLGFLFVRETKGIACSLGIMLHPLPHTSVGSFNGPSIPRTHVFGEEVPVHPCKLAVDVLLLDHLLHPVHCRPVVRTRPTALPISSVTSAKQS